MELEQYFRVLRKWWWLLVACVTVAAVSSYLGTMGMPRIYQATTTVMIGQVLNQINPNTSDMWTSQQLAQTYATMVQRRPIREAAAEALGLNFTPSASARQVQGTQLLEISVRDTDPNRARVIADEIARQLVQQSPTESGEILERQAFVEEQLTDLQVRIQETKDAIDEEQARLEAANSARAIQQYESSIAVLQQKLSGYQSSYASLLLVVQGGVNYISVFELASTPTAPISPQVGETVLLASAIGLILAVGGAFLIEYLDDTVKTPDDVTRVSGLSMLGAIAPINEGDHYSDKLIAAKQPLSPIVEAYRVLRTNIQFSSVDRPMRTLAVTSPGPTEGKSVTVANLAVVMAQAGLRVVAVDADLRRPVLHRIFGLSNNRGLSDVMLQPAANVTEYLQPTEVENLLMLPSGPTPPNPAELLGSERMKIVIAKLAEVADIVLFDSPPALVVTDAVVLGTRVDGVLMVNDSGRTRRGEARQSVEELRRVGGNLLGVVLNRLSLRGDGYYNYHYYYYRSDGDGDGRGDDNHRNWGGRLAGWLPALPRRRRMEQPAPLLDQVSKEPGELKEQAGSDE